MTVGEAAGLLGILERQVKRLLAECRRDGASALAHGHRGKRPANALDPQLENQVLQLAQATYQGFNRHHLTENLRNERRSTSLGPPWTGG